jgi:hypothetical protein
MATDDDLPFKVEQWDQDGNRIERVIARAANVIVAHPGQSRRALHLWAPCGTGSNGFSQVQNRTAGKLPIVPGYAPNLVRCDRFASREER